MTAEPELDDLVTDPGRDPGRELATASLRQMCRALPRCVRTLAGLAWAASPWAAVTMIVAQVVAAALAGYGLVVTARAFDVLLNGGSFPAALPALALVAAVVFARALAETAVAAADARLAPSLRRVAEDRIIHASAYVDLAAFDEPEFYDAMARARDRAVVYINQGAVHVVALGGAVVSLLAMTGTLTMLDPRLVPPLIASVLPQAWATLQNARMGHDVMVRALAANRRLWLTSDLLAHRDCAAELRAYTAQPFLLREYRRLANALERVQINLGYSQTKVKLAGRFLSGAGGAAAYATLGWLLVTGRTSVATAGAAVIGLQAGRGALSAATTALTKLYEQGLYVEDFARFEAEAAARTRPTAGRAAPAPDTITVQDLSFSYPGSNKPAVDGVSLSLRRGEVLALVGENGSGKTTLAMLLAGLYTPSAGLIVWNGAPLTDFDAESVRAQVAVVMQQPARWPLTARQNVAIGRPGRDAAAIESAAMSSGIGEVVAAMPRGWETLLSKKFVSGHDLSGGQWQRLAIARALFRDAPLLICDEPTAAQDAKAEAAVFDSLRRLARGRTVVLITHRLASTRDADQIVVMHQGRIGERGTHADLMAAGGRYAQMYALQARAYA